MGRRRDMGKSDQNGISADFPYQIGHAHDRHGPSQGATRLILIGVRLGWYPGSRTAHDLLECIVLSSPEPQEAWLQLVSMCQHVQGSLLNNPFIIPDQACLPIGFFSLAERCCPKM